MLAVFYSSSNSSVVICMSRIIFESKEEPMRSSPNSPFYCNLKILAKKLFTARRHIWFIYAFSPFIIFASKFSNFVTKRSLEMTSTSFPWGFGMTTRKFLRSINWCRPPEKGPMKPSALSFFIRVLRLIGLGIVTGENCKSRNFGSPF